MDTRGNRSLLLLMGVQMATMFRGGIVSPIMSLLVRRQGLSITEVGILATAGMLGWLIFEPIMGLIADRFQKRYLITIAFIGSSLIYLLYPYASTLLHFILLSFGMSSVMSCYSISVKSLTAELLPVADRGKIYGRFMSGVSIAGIAAPFIGGVITETMGYNLPFYIAAAMGIICIALVWSLKEANSVKKPEGKITAGWRSFLEPNILSIFTIRGIYFINFTFRSNFLPIILNESPRIRASESQIGAYLSIVSIATAVSQAFLGEINDRFGSRRVFLLCSGLLTLSYVALINVDGVLPVYAVGLLQGALQAGADVSLMMLLISVIPSGMTGLAMGLYSEAENIGGILASPAIGWAYAVYGISTAVMLHVAILGTATLFAAALLKKDNKKTSLDSTK
jgi:MFS family permease